MTTPRPTQASRSQAVLLWGGFGACLAGIALHRAWSAIAFPRVFEHLVLALLALGAARLLQRALRWPLATVLAATWLAASLAYLGPLPLAAASLLAGAAIALGSFILPGPVALPLGLVLVAAGSGWWLSFPLHHRATDAIACLALVAWRHDAVAGALRLAWRSFDASARAAPRSAAAAMLLLGLAATSAWLPTMQADDVGYHLGLAWELQATGRYAMAAAHHAWAVAPWAGDVLHGIVQLLAGREARGALNLAWLAIAAGALHATAGALGASDARRWWSVALMASLPLSLHLLAGMQTELPASALLVVLAWLVLHSDLPVARRGMAIALVYGGLWALKPLHGLAALPMLGWAAWRHRHALGAASGLLLALVAALAGGASYAHAWWRTGNPVLPLLNGWFRSPAFPPTDFTDPRWHAGIGIDLPWRLTFETPRYLEGFAGGAGFVLVALAGAWWLALREPRTRALAIVATLALVASALPMQYARYLHPSLVLLLPALVAAYPPGAAARTALWALCALQLAFATNADWMLRTGALKRVLAHPLDDAPLFERYVPERLIARTLRERDDPRPVLVVAGRVGALPELGPRARTTSWYAPALEQAAGIATADPSGQAWARLLRAHGIGHVVVDDAHATVALRNGLRLAGAGEVARVADATAWRLPENAGP